MNARFRWAKKTGKFQHGEHLMLNRVIVANYERNMVIPAGLTGSERQYIGGVHLPCLPAECITVYSKDVDSMHHKLENIVIDWFRSVGVE